MTRFKRFAERFRLPVHTSFRRQMLFDTLHECYAGDLGIGPNPKLLKRIKEFGSGARRRRAAVGNAEPELQPFRDPRSRPAPRACASDSSELGRVYSPFMAINASPGAFAAALESLQPPADLPWRRIPARRNEDYLAWSDPAAITHPGDLQMGQVMAELAKAVPDDAIMANGAGNYAGWVHRFWKFRHYGTQLAPTSGSMGYGLPAAVGAKRAFPERMVISVAGDGCFMMHGQEFATAVQYDLPIIVLIVDNGMYGTIRIAPGARLSRPRLGDHAEEPRFRGLCPRLRRLRRKGRRARKEFRPRPEGSHGQRQAGDHPPPDRPRNHHPHHHALGHPREGDAGKGVREWEAHARVPA